MNRATKMDILFAVGIISSNVASVSGEKFIAAIWLTFAVGVLLSSLVAGRKTHE